jgi:MFS family permease
VVLGPQLTRDAHGITLWGLVLSAYGIGMLLTSVVAYRLRIPRLLATGQLFGVLGALILIALGLGAGPVILLVAAFLGGVGNSLSAISWETSLQEHVRPDMLSRVSSFDELFSFAAIPLGQLLVVPLAGAYGAQQVTLVAGLLFAVFAAAPLASGAVRQLKHATG